jgi:hypothetical protein
MGNPDAFYLACRRQSLIFAGVTCSNSRLAVAGLYQLMASLAGTALSVHGPDTDRRHFRGT